MHFEFSTLLSPLVLGAVLTLWFLIFGAFSVAFIYHWKEYGMNTLVIKTAFPLYFVVSGILCVLALISYSALL